MNKLVDEFTEDEDREGHSSYWEFRRQQVVLQRTHVKFEYLFRLVEYLFLLIILMYSLIGGIIAWVDADEISYLAILGGLIAAGLIVFSRRRKPPVPPKLEAEQE